MGEKLIVSIIFVIYGAVAIAKPDWIARFQVWTNKKILGAKFVPSKRTIVFYRAIGFIFIVFAALTLFAE